MHEITKKSIINTELNKQQYVPIYFFGKCMPHWDVRATIMKQAKQQSK